MSGDALGEGLRHLAARAAVGQQPITAWALDRRRQRPRTGELDLQLAVVALGRRLETVEVLGQQRARPPVVDPGGVGQPPAGGLEVEAELGDDGQRAAGHPRRDPACGELRQERKIGHLAQHQAENLVEIVPRHRADPAGDRALVDHPTTLGRISGFDQSGSGRLRIRTGLWALEAPVTSSLAEPGLRGEAP